MKRRRRSRNSSCRVVKPSTAVEKKLRQDIAALLRDSPAAVPIFKRIVQVLPKPPVHRKSVEKFAKDVEILLQEEPSMQVVVKRLFQMVEAAYSL